MPRHRQPSGGGRGGPRTPTNPAPVSGPGALSRRTDGGPGNPTQPIQTARQPEHGMRQEVEGAQRAVPLPQGQPVVDGPLGPASMMGQSPPPATDIFGPMSPIEEMSPGLDPNAIPRSPDEAIAMLFEVWPSRELLDIMEMRRRDV